MKSIRMQGVVAMGDSSAGTSTAIETEPNSKAHVLQIPVSMYVVRLLPRQKGKALTLPSPCVKSPPCSMKPAGSDREHWPQEPRPHTS